MPLIDVFMLAGIVLVFAVFAVAVTWGDVQSRSIRGPDWRGGPAGRRRAAAPEPAE